VEVEEDRGPPSLAMRHGVEAAGLAVRQVETVLREPLRFSGEAEEARGVEVERRRAAQEETREAASRQRPVEVARGEILASELPVQRVQGFRRDRVEVEVEVHRR